MEGGKVPNLLIGAAGVHFVAFELSRRGLITLPTIRNTAGYDIIVTSTDGKKHANIQVKASGKRVSFWPMPPAEKVRAGNKDYYVLLRWLARDRRFEGFMLTGREAKNAVEQAVMEQRKRHPTQPVKLIFPCVYIREKEKGKAKVWGRRWDTWAL